MALLILGALGGCASHPQGKLSLISLDQQRDFSQTFTQAYICRTPTGDWDIMLVQDGAQPDRHDNPQKPLRPEAIVQPRQYVHVRVFWKTIGRKADHPASTNASVQWCLLGDGPNEGSLLEYGGSGLVVLDDRVDGAGVNIRTAWMKAITQRGSMVDPLGPSRMQGSIRAMEDPDRVKSLLAEMKSETGIAEAQAGPVGGGQSQRVSAEP